MHMHVHAHTHTHVTHMHAHTCSVHLLVWSLIDPMMMNYDRHHLAMQGLGGRLATCGFLLIHVMIDPTMTILHDMCV